MGHGKLLAAFVIAWTPSGHTWFPLLLLGMPSPFPCPIFSNPSSRPSSVPSLFKPIRMMHISESLEHRAAPCYILLCSCFLGVSLVSPTRSSERGLVCCSRVWHNSESEQVFGYLLGKILGASPSLNYMSNDFLCEIVAREVFLGYH